MERMRAGALEMRQRVLDRTSSVPVRIDRRVGCVSPIGV